MICTAAFCLLNKKLLTFFAEGDTRIFWLRPLKSGDKVTIQDERTLCVSDSSALCLPEGPDTELSVSLFRSLSGEWRISSSCARCGPVQVRCQCRNDDQPTHDNLLESPSRVQSPFVGLESPSICQSSVTGDPVMDPSDCDDEILNTATSDPDDKLWHCLSRPNNGKADKFAISFTVEALSAALDQIPSKGSLSELGNNGSALPKQSVPNASDRECTSEFPLPKRDAIWTTVHDIMNDLRESSANVDRDTQTDDSDYESSDDSFKMSETRSDISVKLMQAQKGRRARGLRRTRNESTVYVSMFESDAFSSGEDSDDSGTASMPPSRPGCLSESVQWSDEDGKQIEDPLTDRATEDHAEESVTKPRISPLSPTFHRKLVESLESLAKDQANSARESADIESGSESQISTAPITGNNGKIMASRKCLDEILLMSEISAPPQVVQVYHVTASPPQSPKSPESSAESPPPPASPTQSPLNPTSPTDSQPVSPEGSTQSIAGPSREVNAGAPQASASSSKAPVVTENGAGRDSKEKDAGKQKESKGEGEKSRDKESSHKERKHETEEERRLRKLHKEKKKKKKKKHEHDRDKDRDREKDREKSRSDKHKDKDRDKDREKDKGEDRDKDKDKDRDKDRDKDKERRRKEEKERERAKKDKDKKREHSSSRSSHKTESIKQLGNILSELPVTVTSDVKATTSTAGVQEEEMIIDLGDQFIVEDAQLAWGKDMAQIVAVAPTRRVVSAITVDSSEDEKEAKKIVPKKEKLSEDKNSEKFIAEKEIKKEPVDKPSKTPREYK